MFDRIAASFIAVSLTAFVLGLVFGSLYLDSLFQLPDEEFTDLFQYLQPALIVSVIGTGIAALKFILDYFIYVLTSSSAMYLLFKVEIRNLSITIGKFKMVGGNLP